MIILRGARFCSARPLVNLWILVESLAGIMFVCGGLGAGTRGAGQPSAPPTACHCSSLLSSLH